MYKRIMVLLDGSEFAEKALPLACGLASCKNAEIVLLHIAEYPFEIYGLSDEYSYRDPNFTKSIQAKKTAICQEAVEYLEYIAINLKNDGLKVITEVCEGPVVETILASIDRLNIDLIALSTYGSGGGNPWMMGSVADRVLREAKVPVTLIRPGQENRISELDQLRATHMLGCQKKKMKHGYPPVPS
jgi:nucleotide-binding universal stress UspA family protein